MAANPVGAGGDGSVRITTKLDTAGVKSGMSSLGGIIKAASAAAVAALGTIGLASLRVGSDFEQSMATVQARTGMTETQIQQLSGAFREMGVSSIFSAREIASAYAEIARAGHDVEHATNIMSAAITMATATGNDLGRTAYFLGNYLAKVGKDSSYAERYINLFTHTIAETGISLGDLENYMFRLTPAFEMFGASSEANVAIMSRLYAAGIRNADLYSGLGGIMTDFALAGDFSAEATTRFGVALYDSYGNARDNLDVMLDLAIAMDEYEDSTYAAQFANERLTDTQYNAWFEFQRLASEIRNEVIPGMYEATSATDGTGIAFEMAAIKANTFQNNLRRMKNIVEDLGIEIYQRFNNQISESMGTATIALLKFRESLIDGALSDALDSIAEASANLLGFVLQLAIGALPIVVTALAAFGEIVSFVIGVIIRLGEAIAEKILDSSIPDGINQVREAFARLVDALPDGDMLDALINIFASLIVILLEMAISAIPPLIDGFTWLVETLGGFLAPILESISNAFDDTGQSMNFLKPILAGVLAGFMGFKYLATIKAIFVKFKVVLAGLGAAFAFLLSPIGLVVAALAGLGIATMQIWQTNEEFREFVTQSWENIRESLDRIIGNIKDIFTGLITHIMESDAIERAGELWTETWELVKDILTDIWEFLIGVFDRTIGSIADFLDEHSASIQTTLIDAWDAVSEFLLGIWEDINEFARELFGDLGEYFSEWGEGLGEIFDTALELVYEIVTTVSNRISEFWEQWGETITAIFEFMWNDAKLVIQTAWDQIKLIISTAINLVKEIIGLVLAIIQGDWDQAWEHIKNIFDIVWDFIKETLGRAVDFFRERFDNMLDTAKTIAGNILDNIRQRFSEIRDNIRDRIQEALENLRDRFNNMRDTARDRAQEILDNVRERFQEIKNNIRDKMQEAKQAAIDRFNELRDGVAEALGEVITNVINTAREIVTEFTGIDLFAIGFRIIQSLANGIRGAIGTVTSAVRNVASSIKSTLSSALSFGSPSRWMVDAGDNKIMGGLAIGMEDGITKVERAAKKATDVIKKIFDDIDLEFDDWDFDFPDFDFDFDFDFPDFPDSMVIPVKALLKGATVPIDDQAGDVDITVNLYHYGDINDTIDIDMIGQRLGDKIAQEQRAMGVAY